MGLGDLTWLQALGSGSPLAAVVGVLILVWRREAKRADRWEQVALTSLDGLKEFAENQATLTRSVERLAVAVDGWGTTGGKHRVRDGWDE